MNGPASRPDIMALAKGIGGGFPLGACLATADAAKGMTAGTHGSTFGGNPLAMAVGKAVLDVVLADGFLDHVRRMGLYFKQRLAGGRRRPSRTRRRSARRGPADRRPLPEAGRRRDRRHARRRAARRRRRRQRRAPAAAADRHRSRDRRGDRRGSMPRSPRSSRPGPPQRVEPMVRHFLDLADIDASDAPRRSSPRAGA